MIKLTRGIIFQGVKSKHAAKKKKVGEFKGKCPLPESREMKMHTNTPRNSGKPYHFHTFAGNHVLGYNEQIRTQNQFRYCKIFLTNSSTITDFTNMLIKASEMIYFLSYTTQCIH